MLFPAFREKILGLPRLLKVLLLILFILILIIGAEGTYYLWMSKRKAEESKYFSTEIAYQKGVLLHDKTTNEPIAARGWVRKIDNGILTLENQGEEVFVEMEDEFRYSVIQEVGENTEKFDLVVGPKTLKLVDLANNVKNGDFVVVDRLTFLDSGIVKGETISVLNN